MRVLVVDDETQVRRIREQLASRGIEVVGTPCADDVFLSLAERGPVGFGCHRALDHTKRSGMGWSW
jgi:hypothetical protein